MNWNYCSSLTEYKRRLSHVVQIGDLPMGGNYPIRIQSMTTIDTMDTQGSVQQCIRMINSGCEYIRITAPSIKEAQNLGIIKKELNQLGYKTPLIADIHFTPNAAEVAARLVEKVRINPGNYVDKKKFETIEYSDSSYEQEIERIRDKFIPLIKICKEYGTAMRIGTNHGSLSDRILSRYGDTPIGMVESALEFLRICEEYNYFNIVLSMKASNTQVMVQAYRLLVQKLEEENLKPYPLHLGVTEAGEGEDGRIKSAVGIGALLEDGLGDTVRVSLTEEPEYEAPVAKMLIDRYINRGQHKPIQEITTSLINPYQYFRRNTNEVLNIGAINVPRVIMDISGLESIDYNDLKQLGHYYLPLTDKWGMTDLGTDYIYTGSSPISFMLPNGLKEIVDDSVWQRLDQKQHVFPLFTLDSFQSSNEKHLDLNFIRVNYKDFTPAFYTLLLEHTNIVLILYTQNLHAMPALRRLTHFLIEKGIKTPIVLERSYLNMPDEQLQLFASTDCGSLLIDGLGDGIFLSTRENSFTDRQEKVAHLKTLNNLSFGILQAARTRMSKTEYISCPSCGRTLFDLQETTAMIRKRTDHLKGIKIGIMGCIVNGPGEMADADYGYVGVGKDKIALYRGQNVVKKAVSSDKAVDELIELIREDGKWIEATQEIDYQ
ncbi:MAG: 4-hydroxy-3-methylbut-2-en-1-yl diphosphate synthase [Cytophagales bacterium]|nr:MAG: 4-hydroxy-3-methylbut-2-en-1-yl diphosphate synthase [Cytophagales bacterium]